MKLPTVLLVGSLTVNLALASMLLWRPAATRAFFREAFGSRAAPPLEARSGAIPTAPTPPPLDSAAADHAPFAAFDWANLQPADYATIRTHFTGMGIPADTVRAITAVLIMKHYEERRRVLRGHPDPMEYWRNPHPRPDPQMLAASRELEREGKKVLREVLGGDFSFDDDAASERRRFGNLPVDKIANLKKIFADYSDLEEQLYADGADRGSAEMRARSALLAREKRADIERLLTPGELLDYDLRNSPAAHRLRGKFGAFEGTEAEFRALYPAFKSIADAEPQPGGYVRGNAAEMRRAREAAERQLEAELRRVLGEARYAQWQEANDHGAQETRALVASLNLPPVVATDVVAIQKDFQPKLAAVERDRDLTANQRDAQLAALAIEARNRLTRVLGPSGFEAYKRRGGGWLGAALSRSAPTPSVAP